MKLVIAVISADKLASVREALPEPDAYIYYVSLTGDVHNPVQGNYRGGSYWEPRSRLRVEIIVVNEMLLEEVIRVVTIAASMNSGHDFTSGNIFVVPLENWIRIPDAISTPDPALESKVTQVVSP